MIYRMLSLATVACLTMFPCGLRAQTTATTASTGDPIITFEVPVRLTQVMSDIAKIAVYCRINSTAFTTRVKFVGAQAEVPVTAGQVNTTVTVNVVASNLSNASGVQADYSCTLTGFSTSRQAWDVFSDTHTIPAFKLSPTPVPIAASFRW